MKAALLYLALLSLPCLAQAQVYKWVGPDGKVSYSDSPPPAGTKSVQRPQIEVEKNQGSNLPWALQQAVNAHPVTLYTTRDCQPCEDARKWLAQRGVPLRERTVNSKEDLDELKSLAGANQLPTLRVGSVVKRGFDVDGWQQALNTAGYPEQSRLPANWRNAEPAPLAAQATPAAPRETAPRASSRVLPKQSTESNESAAAPSNAPPGFRF